MAAETGYTIDGAIYERPNIFTLTMRERRLMHDLCGYVQEDFIQQDGEDDAAFEQRVERMASHPGFMEAQLHIAYQRGNRDKSLEEVRAVVDETEWLSAIVTLRADEEDDQSPPELTTEPARSSETSSVGKSESSGSGSVNGSDRPDGSLPNTGITRSGTSSISPPTRLAI